MTRRHFKYTPFAAALQAAGLLIVASCVVGILISEFAHKNRIATNLEASARVQ